MVKTSSESQAWRPGIPGWSRDILIHYSHIAERIPQGGTFVEVGVFLGRSLAFMGELRPDLQLWAIDPWLDDASVGYMGAGEYTDYVRGFSGLWPAFLQTMYTHAPDVLNRTHVMRGTLREVAFLFSPDFVFIDGAHDYESVKFDIEQCAAQMKPGSILAGHDYVDDYPGVKRAVDEHFADLVQIDEIGDGTWSSCWWVPL